MTPSSKPNPEQPDTYAVQGLSDDEELNRLRIQDQLVTSSMGGIWPEQTAPIRFERVLDIGCGPGSWLIEVAQTYPHISKLVGVDINPKMVDAARRQAKALHIDDRMEFHQMDALSSLTFPDEHFDL